MPEVTPESSTTTSATSRADHVGHPTSRPPGLPQAVLGRAATAPPDSAPGPAAIVLAAGKGTRMRSGRHKALHRLAGKSMIWHVLTALLHAGFRPPRISVVVGE